MTAQQTARAWRKQTAATPDELADRLGRDDLLNCDDVAAAVRAAQGWLPTHDTIRTWVAKHQMPAPVGYAPFPPPEPGYYTGMFDADEIDEWIAARAAARHDPEVALATVAREHGIERAVMARQVQQRFAAELGWEPSLSTLRAWVTKGDMPAAVDHVTLPIGPRRRAQSVAIFDAAQIETWLQQRPEALSARHSRAIRTAADDQALLEAIRQARSERVSWSAIGAALGVTQQAAHARFAHRLR